MITSIKYYSIVITIKHNNEDFYNKNIFIAASLNVILDIIDSIEQLCEKYGDDSYRLDITYNKISPEEIRDKNIQSNAKEIIANIEEELDNIFNTNNIMEVKMY